MRRKDFFLKDGTLFATGYNRVVIGGRGAYIEFEQEHIVASLKTKPGQEWRGHGKYIHAKYFWLCPTADESVKIYHQRGTVDYADYKVGKYYVSPRELVYQTEALHAEIGMAPGIAKPTLYKPG